MSPEFVCKVYNIHNQQPGWYLDEAVTSMAQHNPVAAQRLLKMIVAYSGNYPPSCLPVINALGKKNPAAALALAKAQPADMRTAALLAAAAFQPRATARTLILESSLRKPTGALRT